MKKRYSKQLSFGYDESGNRIRKRFYYDNKADLNRQIEDFKKAVRISTDTERISFKDYAERWLETFKKNKQPSTYQMYKHYIDMALPIHNAPLFSITATDCQELINQHTEHPRTCALLSLTLNNVFNKAIEEDKIDKNPASNLEVPKYQPKERRPLLDTEIEAIRNTDFRADEKLFVDLIYTYGLRPSEALALTFADVTRDFITINKALGFDRHRSFIKETKTGDKRILPTTEQVYTDYLILKAESTDKSGLMFRDINGNRMSKTAAEKFKKRVMNKIMQTQGFDSHLTAYIFRHNRITEMIYDGVMTGKTSTKMVAKLMGNSEKMVNEVYSHIKSDRENVFNLYKDIRL